MMNYSNTLAWDAKYDVIVIGFGGAGATAARYAAKQDNRVLLIDAAPEGSEGGNTRFAAGALPRPSISIRPRTITSKASPPSITTKTRSIVSFTRSCS